MRHFHAQLSPSAPPAFPQQTDLLPPKRTPNAARRPITRLVAYPASCRAHPTRHTKLATPTPTTPSSNRRSWLTAPVRVHLQLLLHNRVNDLNDHECRTPNRPEQRQTRYTPQDELEIEVVRHVSAAVDFTHRHREDRVAR